MKRKDLKKHIKDKDQLFLVMRSLQGVPDKTLAGWTLLQTIEYTNKWCSAALRSQSEASFETILF